MVNDPRYRNLFLDVNVLINRLELPFLMLLSVSSVWKVGLDVKTGNCFMLFLEVGMGYVLSTVNHFNQL